MIDCVVRVTTDGEIDCPSISRCAGDETSLTSTAPVPEVGQPFDDGRRRAGFAFTTAVGTDVDVVRAVAVLRGDAHAHRVADVDALQDVRLVGGAADRGAAAAGAVAATPLVGERDRRRAVPRAVCSRSASSPPRSCRRWSAATGSSAPTCLQRYRIRPRRTRRRSRARRPRAVPRSRLAEPTCLRFIVCEPPCRGSGAHAAFPRAPSPLVKCGKGFVRFS